MAAEGSVPPNGERARTPPPEPEPGEVVSGGARSTKLTSPNSGENQKLTHGPLDNIQHTPYTHTKEYY